MLAKRDHIPADKESTPRIRRNQAGGCSKQEFHFFIIPHCSALIRREGGVSIECNRIRASHEVPILKISQPGVQVWAHMNRRREAPAT